MDYGCFGDFAGKTCYDRLFCEFALECSKERNKTKGYCTCKYKEHYHPPRQKVQQELREEFPDLTVKDCDFYKMF